MTPLCVTLASSADRARPKSVILISLFPFSSKMLAGLTSRWISPLSWAAASPAAIFSPIDNTSVRSRGPIALIRCCSVGPSINSMTRNGIGSSSTA